MKGLRPAARARSSPPVQSSPRSSPFASQVRRQASAAFAALVLPPLSSTQARLRKVLASGDQASLAASTPDSSRDGLARPLSK
jgi:hypothetical protein